MDFSEFLKKWEEYLNNDGELRRRISKDIKVRSEVAAKTFAGMPDGHYEYARQLQAKYKIWPRFMALRHYPFGGTTQLDGKDVIEIVVPGKLAFSVSLENEVFRIREGKAIKPPCLSVEMPVDVLKDMLTTRHRVLWCLADPRNKVKCVDGLPHGDWITIFEILVTLQEVVDMDPKMRKIVESL